MQKSKVYAWAVVGMLWFVALLNYLDRQMLSTMQPAMKMDIPELAKAENFGRLMAIFLWIYAFMSPISGILADRLNRKIIIVGSLFVWSAVTYAMGYAQTFEQLYILRSVMGVSEAFYIPAGLALIADYHQGKTRSIAIGIHTTGIYLGQAFGGFGSTVAGFYSWQSTFHFFGLTGMVYSIILIYFLKENKSYIVVPIKNASIGFKFNIAIKGLILLFSNIAFWFLLFYFSAPSFPGWTVKNWLPTLFSDTLKLEMSKAGPMATITTALSALVGVLVGGIISDKWIQTSLKGRIYTGVIGLSLTIPALFLLGFGFSLEHILLGAILFGLGFGIFDVNNMPILCQFLPPQLRATGFGMMNLAGISCGAFITDFIGKSADAGNMKLSFAILSVPTIIAIFFQLTFLKPTTSNKV